MRNDWSTAHNRRVLNGRDQTLILELEALAQAHPSGDTARELARVEDALADGATEALALETERLRLSRRIAEQAASLRNSEREAAADELSTLVQRLSTAEGELSRLRRALGSLRLRLRELRVA